MPAGIWVKGTNLLLVKGDITRERVDAIVNAANSGLMGGGGVDGAIHRAGGGALKEECGAIVSRIGRLQAGQAVITTGGNLPAVYVIHTVGPVWHGGNNRETEILASCYLESLRLATAHSLKSISFPAISTGIYGYPQKLAAGIAITTVNEFLYHEQTTLKSIVFVLFDSYSYEIYGQEMERIINQDKT